MQTKKHRKQIKTESWGGQSRENSRSRRGTKERVIMERLERKPAKKLGHASLVQIGIVFWAVVDVHDHNEDSNIGHHKHRNQP